MNDQRKVIFDQRIEWMQDAAAAEIVADMRHDAIDDLVAKHVPENAYPEQWDVAGLKEELKRVLGIELPVDEWAKEEGIADEELFTRVERRADEHMASKVAQWGSDVIRYVEKSILLQTLDHLWREHLVMLDHLRQVVGLRGYAQRDPLNEYKSEAFNLFETMSQHLREAVTAQLMRVEIMPQPVESTMTLPAMEAHKIDPTTGEDEMALAMAGAETLARHGIGVARRGRQHRAQRRAAERNPKDPTTWGKVGRNEACPCGSGKKFKHCHGRSLSAPDGVRLTRRASSMAGLVPAIRVFIYVFEIIAARPSGCRNCRRARPAAQPSIVAAAALASRCGAGFGLAATCCCGWARAWCRSCAGRVSASPLRPSYVRRAASAWAWYRSRPCSEPRSCSRRNRRRRPASSSRRSRPKICPPATGRCCRRLRPAAAAPADRSRPAAARAPAESRPPTCARNTRFMPPSRPE